MKEKKHIDRIFQERLKDFESTPDPKVWDSIQTSLKDEKRDRKVIPLWWKIAGVAAGFLVLLTLGNLLLQDDIISQQPEEQYTEQPAEKMPDESVLFKQDSLTTISDNNGVKPSSITDNIENLQNSTTKNSSNGPGVAASNSEKKALTSSKLNNNKVNTKTAVASNTKETNSSANTKEEVVAENRNDNQKKNDSAPINRDSELIKNSDTQKVTSIDNPKTDSTSEDLISEEDEIDMSEETQKLMAIEDAIAESETTNEKEKTPINRWAISPNVAPVYFNSLGKGSPISSQFIDNTKTGDIEMSYGVTGSYAVNEKLKVRVGVNNVNLGYSTQDVVVYENLSAVVGNGENVHIAMRESSTNTAFLSASSISANEAPNILVNNIKGSIDQEFGFIEVPMEVEYNLFQDKFGINLIGGFSTFFLNKNEVYSTLSRQREYVGEATNLNNTSYSANFGLGINYSISKLLDINLEPIFKYQFNTFTDTSGNFNPYIFGVYSGVRFKF